MGKRLTKGRAAVLTLTVLLLFGTVISIAALTGVAAAAPDGTTTTTPTGTPTTTTTTGTTTTPSPTETPTTTPTGTSTTTPANASSSGEPDRTFEYSISDSFHIVNTTWTDDGTLIVTLHTDLEQSPVKITDAGVVQNTGSNQVNPTPTRTYWISEGTNELRFTVQNEERVTLATPDGMVTVTGDLNNGLIDVIKRQPTVALIQWTLIAGAAGTLLSLAGWVGFLRRRHENTYREELSEERVDIHDDPVEGLKGRVERAIVKHRRALLVAAGVVGYLTLVAAGTLPGPGKIWDGMTDPQRMLVAGSLAAYFISSPFTYLLAVRLWEPTKEFVVSFDITDALSVSAGSEGGVEEFIDDLRGEDGELDIEELVDNDGDDQVALSVYSGSPERVSQLTVEEGEPAEIRSPGGQTHLVRNFDPEENRATGTWPGTAHDAVIAMENSAISWNREVLEDESDAFRTLLGGLGAMRSASNSSAAVALNKEIAASTDIDDGPVNDILDRALSSTRYAGYFNDDEEDDGDAEGDEYNDRVDTEDDDSNSTESGGDE